jgi:hypothetical protein
MLDPDPIKGLPPEALGPKMLALSSDKMRLYAWYRGLGEMNSSRAARDAGYTEQRSRVVGVELNQHEGVLAAVEEVARKFLIGLAPVAIAAARRILEDPKHKDHARMIETIMDRTGFSAKTEHKVTVEHTVDTREIEELARRLALESGVPVERLIGKNKVIEHVKQDELGVAEGKDGVVVLE